MRANGVQTRKSSEKLSNEEYIRKVRGEWDGTKRLGRTERDAGPSAAGNRLALAGLGGFLHLPLFGYDCHVEQAECQDHHHKNECHEPNLTTQKDLHKITAVPGW